ncbi:hypothetical protein Daus18300_004643 [Diaporthe australafricana]|uniref:C6 finger domain-containing protein n=1 Tax=Diaporthe australafricana TaxID=127596 RepID=A0ABR3X6U0_9PEZI
MTHLELYHHFIQLPSSNYFFYLATPEMADIVKSSTLEHSVQVPYLMHQLLAVSARDKSRRATDDDEKASYLQLSLQLQNHAITMFEASNTRPPSATNPKQSIPILSFSAMVGVHALCDTLTALDEPAPQPDMVECQRSSLQNFLARWLDYIRLHRGINSHVLAAADLIYTTELRPLLLHGRSMSENQPAGHQTDVLLARVAGLKGLSPQVLAACLTAVDGLQVAIDMGNETTPPPAEGGAAVAASPEYLAIWWALSVPEGFVEALSTGVPELVAVLAYYAVLLHRARASWAVGGAGTKLLRILTAHLGIKYTEVLAFPRKELGLGHFDAVYDAVRGWTERSSP